MMTNPSGDRDTVRLSGLRVSGKMDCHPRRPAIYPDPPPPESLRSNSKQKMTGPEGNRQINLPLEIPNRLPKSFY